MKKLKALFLKWRETIKVSVSNPENFDELWSISTSRIQFYSFLAVIVLLLSIGFSILIAKTTLRNYFVSGGNELPRKELIEQKLQIDKLTSKVNAQEKYVENIRSIILGKTPEDKIKKIKNKVIVDPSSVNSELSPEEQKNAAKVKDDQRTNTGKKPALTMHFIAPLKGLVRQKFDITTSNGIILETMNNRTVLSCLSGTVIYSGFTQKDGNVILIEHPNNFISVYKNSQSRLKKAGDKVRTGDPIAITANSNDVKKKVVIHFELWLNQKPIDPLEYIDF